MRDTHHRRPLGRQESGLLPPPSSPSLPTHSLPGASCHTPSASQQQRIPNKQDRCVKHASHLSQILERFSGVPTHARCVNYCMSAFITLNVMMMAASGECLCRSACTEREKGAAFLPYCSHCLQETAHLSASRMQTKHMQANRRIQNVSLRLGRLEARRAY